MGFRVKIGSSSRQKPVDGMAEAIQFLNHAENDK